MLKVMMDDGIVVIQYCCHRAVVCNQQEYIVTIPGELTKYSTGENNRKK